MEEERGKGAIANVQLKGAEDIGDLFRPWAAPCFNISVITGFIGSIAGYGAAVVSKGIKTSNSKRTYMFMYVGFVSLFLFRWETCESSLRQRSKSMENVQFQQTFTEEYYQRDSDE